MSQYPGQYPSPYQGYPSPYGGYSQAPFDAYMGPFRKAAIMTFVVGGLICACGIFCTALPWRTLLPEMMAQQGRTIPQEISLDDATIVYRVMGVVTVLMGALHIGLGFFVRKGSYAATITGIVFAVLELLVVLILLVLALLAGGLNNLTNLGSLACTIGLPAAALTLMLIWLVQAARAAPLLRAAQAQYQYEYWQYAQAQQGYGQASPQAPPAPPPPPPPPAAPPQDWPPGG